MKKQIRLSILVLGITALCSCGFSERQEEFEFEKKEEILGRSPDVIKLSAKTAELRSSGDTIIFKTGGTWWWVAGISINQTHYSDFDVVSMVSSTYYSIQRNCLTFERLDKNTISIKVDENPLETNRVIGISLEAGDYFDGITLTQKGNTNSPH